MSSALQTVDRDLPPIARAQALSPERRRNPARQGPVLLAMDGTWVSDAPLLAARLAAERMGVALRVVTVLEPIPRYPRSPEMSLPESVEAERRVAREASLRYRLQTALGPSADWQLDVRYGPVAREVAALAQELSASLVVVGSAPHRRLRRRIAGGRALQMLRDLRCPVLSVAPQAEPTFARAVVAVDFGAASIRAAHAALLLVPDGGVLTMLHVLMPREIGVPLSEAALDTGVATLFVRLREELRPYVPPGVSLETRTVTSSVADGVLRLGDDLDADLIAVGTHGPGVVERLFVGSVAADVLHGASGTVLASPAPGGAESVRIGLRMMGSAATTGSGDWAAVLDGVTLRNPGRPVTIEVNDPEIGAQVQARGYRLMGATYDHNDRRVDLMLGDPAGAQRHLTRTIEGVDEIALCSGTDGRDHVLELRHGRGQTLVVFGD
jgi:nucleotide-binding universal stress UspA family protein